MNYQCEGQTDIFDFLMPALTEDKQPHNIRLFSMFSGIGAFEKALDRLGINYELVGFSEIDKYATKSYCAIHGVDESMNHGDITKVDEKALPKNIDLVTYGFPCQDISLAGKQKGLFNEDGTQTRSGLFFEALRIIEETQPRVAIAENVKNLVGKKFKEQFQIVLDSLEKAGYTNYWKVLNAKDFGIPQNRERVFIVSIRKDIDTGCFRFPEGFPLELRLKDMLEDEVDEKFFLNHKDTDLCKILNEISEDTKGCIQVGYLDRPTIHDFSNRVYSTSGIARTLMGSGGNQNDKAGQYLIEQPRSTLDSDLLRIRKLTPKECFRLMGFDDSDFEKAEAVNSNTQLYKQAGNSIVVPVLEHIIKALTDCGAL